MYENKALCAECGGECCKTLPGLCLPSDFGQPADRQRRITKALKSGRYRLERSNPSKILSVRPATKGREGILIDGLCPDMTTCTFLQDDGCELSIRKRPYDCRTLEPRPDRGCLDRGMGEGRMITRWIPLQAMLRKIMREIEASRTSMNNS